MINEYGLEHLELMEERKLYPPNFEITARRSSTAEDSHVDFIFQGATEEIVKRISLNTTKGVIYIIFRLIGRCFYGITRKP